jgi:hypothetical protein
VRPRRDDRDGGVLVVQHGAAAEERRGRARLVRAERNEVGRRRRARNDFDGHLFLFFKKISWKMEGVRGNS